LKNPQTTPSLNKVKLLSEVKLHIPKNVLDQIKFLCRKVHDVEWSGVLLYEVTGSIEDKENLLLTAKHIIHMDIGTAAETGFNWTGDGEPVVSYLLDHDEAENWILGHVHSHHTMPTFFSTVDERELNNNSPQFNIYLSLIVNNRMDMVAKVAFIGESSSFICKDFNGKRYDMSLKGSEKTMFWHTCDITTEETIVVPDEFEKRFEEVRELNKKKPKITYPAYPNNSPAQSSKLIPKQQDTPNPKVSPFPSWEDVPTHSVPVHNRQTEDNWENTFNRLENESNKPDKVAEEELLLAYMIRLGNEFVNDDLKDALEDLELSNINIDAICEYIKMNFYTMYQNFYNGLPSENPQKELIIFFDYAISILTEHIKTWDNISFKLSNVFVALLDESKQVASKSSKKSLV
jgi:proteasome lid subunit RPN8/RPN11